MEDEIKSSLQNLLVKAEELDEMLLNSKCELQVSLKLGKKTRSVIIGLGVNDHLYETFMNAVHTRIQEIKETLKYYENN